MPDVWDQAEALLKKPASGDVWDQAEAKVSAERKQGQANIRRLLGSLNKPAPSPTQQPTAFTPFGGYQRFQKNMPSVKPPPEKPNLMERGLHALFGHIPAGHQLLMPTPGVPNEITSYRHSRDQGGPSVAESIIGTIKGSEAAKHFREDPGAIPELNRFAAFMLEPEGLTFPTALAGLGRLAKPAMIGMGAQTIGQGVNRIRGGDVGGGVVDIVGGGLMASPAAHPLLNRLRTATPVGAPMPYEELGADAFNAPRYRPEVRREPAVTVPKGEEGATLQTSQEPGAGPTAIREGSAGRTRARRSGGQSARRQGPVGRVEEPAGTGQAQIQAEAKAQGQVQAQEVGAGPARFTYHDNFPIDRLDVNKDVAQFKEGADPQTGVVPGEQLEGGYERLATGPIVVWEKLDGTREVITGRHRLDLARRNGETHLPVQIVREANGFTRDMAHVFDAEANIRDGKGSVKDYARYFASTTPEGLTEGQARSRGLLQSNKGRSGFDLGRNASDDVRALYLRDSITEQQALAIARTAPGEAGLQQVGARYALQGRDPDFIGNVMQAVKAAPKREGATNLFGEDDSAMQQAEEQAKRAGEIVKDIRNRVQSASGASKRPELARELGVDVNDPNAVQNEVARLRGELQRWQKWAMYPDLVQRTLGAPEPTRATGQIAGTETPVTRAERVAVPSGVDVQAGVRAAARAKQAGVPAEEARPQVMKAAGVPEKPSDPEIGVSVDMKMKDGTLRRFRYVGRDAEGNHQIQRVETGKVSKVTDAQLQSGLKNTKARISAQPMDEEADIAGEPEKPAAPVQEPAKPAETPRQQKITDAQKAQADALARMRARGSVKGKQAGAVVGPEDWKDLGIYTKAWIQEKGLKFADWSSHMLDTFGDWVQEHLPALWKEHAGQEVPAEATATEKPAKYTGISEDIRRGKAEQGIAPPYQPGEGKSPEEMYERGRSAVVDQHVDPEAHLQMLEQGDRRFNDTDMAIMRYHDDELATAADNALTAHLANPTDPALAKAYQDALTAENSWYERISPYRTAWQRIGTAQQGWIDLRTGDFSSTRLFNWFADVNKRGMTPEETKQALDQSSRILEVQGERDALKQQLAEAISKQQPRSTGRRSGKSPMPKTAADRIAYFAKRRNDPDFLGTVRRRSRESGAVPVPGGRSNWTQMDIKVVWEHAKGYMDDQLAAFQGNQRAKAPDFDDVVASVSKDLGLDTDDVRWALGQNKAVRTITPDMYRKMAEHRRLIDSAKNWAADANLDGYGKVWRAIVELPRGIRVFGHGIVGMITHAGPAGAEVTNWPMYWRNFGRQFRFFLDEPYHEALMQDIMRDPEFSAWRRAGLAVDPRKTYDNYQQYGKWIGSLGRRGNYGMDALKTFRMEYAKRIWDGIDPQLRDEPGMREWVAKTTNHITGASELTFGKASGFLFAPSLEAARWQRYGDVLRSVGTLAKWRSASPAQRYQAMWTMKKTVQLASVYLGALAANDAMLKGRGSKDRVNWSDPTKADWLRFKGAGRMADPTGGALQPIRLLGAISLIGSGISDRYRNQPKREELGDTIWNYIQGKMTPIVGVGMDVASQQDFMGRPFPFSPERGTATKPKYSWAEYIGSQGPIPFAGMTEMWNELMREHGLTDQQRKEIMVAASLAELTGVRAAPSSKHPPDTRAHWERVPKWLREHVLPKHEQAGRYNLE